MIMGVQHREPARSTACSSIPKSIASEHGHQILKNFLDIAAA